MSASDKSCDPRNSHVTAWTQAQTLEQTLRRKDERLTVDSLWIVFALFLDS